MKKEKAHQAKFKKPEREHAKQVKRTAAKREKPQAERPAK